MKNNLLYLLKSKLVLRVSGKNISNFIKKINNYNINLLNIKYIDDYILITIYKNDYEEILKYKTIYNVEIIDYMGLIKIKNKLIKNYILIFFCVVSVIILYILSNVIFSINIITNDNKEKLILINELKKYDIKKYSFKKNYNYREKVKNKILEKYRDSIEWIEIEEFGTKYVIKYEPRIKNKENINNGYNNVVAKKDAVITKIVAHTGEVVKFVNTYVKKGEVIINGKIYLNDELKEIKNASGTIYGEVWYKVNIKYPLNYYENKETGKTNNMLSIIFLSKRYNFNSKYKTSNLKDKTIIKNNILPISIVLSKEYETKVIDESNSYDEAILKATNKSIDKINSNLDSDEYIKDYKIMRKNIYDNYVELEIFFTVVENITDYKKIVD